MSKRLGSHYRSGRPTAWHKVKKPGSAKAVRREGEEDWKSLSGGNNRIVFKSGASITIIDCVLQDFLFDGILLEPTVSGSGGILTASGKTYSMERL
jgi:hypothetical protein